MLALPAWYFDGVMARESAASLDERMEQATPYDPVNSHHNEGFADNPAAP